MRYIIAQQMRMAANIIRVELKDWKLVNRARFEYTDSDGELVRIISGSGHSLQGIRFDRLYLAHGWREAMSESERAELFQVARAFNARITYVYRNGEMRDA